MIKVLLLLPALLFSFPHAQDVKVATWTSGTPETDNFESLAFWIKGGKRAYIRYLHGQSSDDIELRWLGPDSTGAGRGFKAAFPAPDSRILLIATLDDSTLLVTTRGHSKKYRWENENASPDSDCDICAADATEATGWLRRYFWR